MNTDSEHFNTENGYFEYVLGRCIWHQHLFKTNDQKRKTYHGACHIGGTFDDKMFLWNGKKLK